MEDTENSSQSFFQGNEIDANHEEGTPPTSTNRETEEQSTEPAGSKGIKSAESNQQDQAQVQAQKIDYEKSYRELEKTYTRDSQRRAQYEKEVKEYKALVDQYRAIDEKLVQNPEAMKYLQQLFNGQKQVDPVTANDPLYKHIEPLIGEVQQMKNYVQDQMRAQETLKAETFLDQQMANAASEIKSHFGREMTKEDTAKIYAWMSENNNTNGKTAVRDLFWDDFGTAKAQATLASQHAKKGLGTTKTAQVNSNSAKNKVDDKPMNFQQAWKASLKELAEQ